MNQPVKVPKAASLVAASLRRRIVLGDLGEGDALPNETELMRFYEVSRPTLREALRILETESLISVKRGARGGARVVRPRRLRDRAARRARCCGCRAPRSRTSSCPG